MSSGGSPVTSKEKLETAQGTAYMKFLFIIPVRFQNLQLFRIKLKREKKKTCP